MNIRNRKAFTLIEILIIVTVIGLLIAIIIVSFAMAALNKAAINSYKTSMDSLANAVELCTGTGGIAQSGTPNNFVCRDQVGNPIGDSRFPQMPDKCGSQPYFNIYLATEYNWTVDTCTNSTCNNAWDCRGCRLSCEVTGCQEIGVCN